MSSSQSSSSSSSAAGTAPPPAPAPFAALGDVPCHVEVVLGTRTLRVRDCLGIQPGEILKIDQAAGADMTLLINGVPVATGEVLVVDDHTSVRVTEVLPAPRGEIL